MNVILMLIYVVRIELYQYLKGHPSLGNVVVAIPNRRALAMMTMMIVGYHGRMQLNRLFAMVPNEIAQFALNLLLFLIYEIC